MSESSNLKEGHQFSFGTMVADKPPREDPQTSEIDEEKKEQNRRVGGLMRALSKEDDGIIYRRIRRLKDANRNGSLALERILYEDGAIDATREDLEEVIRRRKNYREKKR